MIYFQWKLNFCDVDGSDGIRDLIMVCILCVVFGQTVYSRNSECVSMNGVSICI